MAGARIDEAKGVRKVMVATQTTMVHLRLELKLSGMAGSSWPSQPTRPLSRSVTGMGSGTDWESPLRVRLELAMERLLLAVV